MQRTVEISAAHYEEMRKQPLFFVKIYEYIFYDVNGKKHYKSEWESVDRNLEISFSDDTFGQQDLGYCLCIIEKAEQSYDSKGNPKEGWVKMFFHDASASSETDCLIALNDCIFRSNDKEDKYAFVKLLWFLDKRDVNINVLSCVIRKYDVQTIPFILDIFRHICRCLSLKKQNEIKSLFDLFGERYEVYMPAFVIEAFQLCKPSISKENINLFQLIDEIVGYESANDSSEDELSSSNLLLQLKSWLYFDDGLKDYNILKLLFSMVAEPIRLEIIKRYFHDIRLGNTTFDADLVMQFKDNHFDEFIRYRYATETPTEGIVLTVSLLCDNILTLYNSKGKSFQTFDGILDFAITHCDKANPSINFKMDRFIPTCEHGAVYNNDFKGFIDYQFIRKLNQVSLTDSSLLDCIRQILDRYGERQQYPVCRFGDGSKIEACQFANCSKVLTSKKYPHNIKLDCYTYKNYDDRWFVYSNATNVIVLNTFLAESIEESNSNLSIDFSMISIDVFRNYILSLPAKFEKVGDEEFLVHSYKSKDRTFMLMLIEQFSEILRMRILPQNGAVVGISFDVFGYWKGQIRTLSPEQLKNNHSPEYKAAYNLCLAKEAEEVNKRTVESLKKELGIQDYNGSYFELPYKRDVLVKVLNKYYFKESFKDGEDISKHEFLIPSDVKGNFKPYCAPQLSEVNNQAIDLPYFWCRGKECFHNNLEKQTLSETNDWHAYSLYHLIEIIGYPKLHATIAGNEPDPVVWSFIAVTNKAMQKFRRLKCRACGHLMFTDKSSGFNRYNYYSCINPTCSEAWKPVYLSYCYKCKKGLIDSRDTKRCPNGWYICPCPTCLACCDDAQYERQAQRYILSNRPIPDRIKKMLGHGHNDKGDYFCPNCGTHIEMVQDEHGNYFRGCPTCHQKFNEKPDDYLNYNAW